MLGQAHHFLRFNKGKSEYAEKRYGDEAKRIYGVLDTRLGEAEYLAGRVHDRRHRDLAVDLALRMARHRLVAYPHLKRWYLAIAKRPAVQRGYDVPKHVSAIPLPG